MTTGVMYSTTILRMRKIIDKAKFNCSRPSQRMLMTAVFDSADGIVLTGGTADAVRLTCSLMA